MQQLVQTLTASLPTSLLDWALAFAAVALLAFLIARLRLPSLRKADAPQVAPVPSSRLAAEPQRTREEIARAADDQPSLAAMQAQANSQIDAAEHAFNRLLGECSAVMELPVEPTLEASRELPRQPEPAPARSSLAA